MELWRAGSEPQGGLIVQQFGQEACAPGHQYGPAVRDHILIHFVASGKGTFWSGGKAFSLSQGQGFIIFPGQLTTYRADDVSPWAYAWVGYSGSGAEWLTSQVGLTRENPVFTCAAPEAIFTLIDSMIASAASLRLGFAAALGDLYRLLALMGEWQQRASPDIHQEYYQKALWFMEGNFDRPIQITDVAAFVGLSRSQLFRVFQQVAGTSPKACLRDIRMAQAQMLLASSSLSFEEIAASVGISSPARLGLLFKEVYGITPGQYRKRVTKQ